MFKKILAGLAVASTLNLASCGYSPDEQKVYDTCVTKTSDPAKLAILKQTLVLNGSNSKEVCAHIIEQSRKNLENIQASDEEKKANWDRILRILEEL